MVILGGREREQRELLKKTERKEGVTGGGSGIESERKRRGDT